MLIIAADVVDQQSLSMMKEQHTAEHIGLTVVADDFRMAAWIANRNSEVVILDATIVRHSRTRAREHENARFTVATDFIVAKCRLTLRAIQYDAGKNAFHRPALRNEAAGIQDVDGRMLITADIPKRDAGDPSAGYALQIQRTTAA